MKTEVSAGKYRLKPTLLNALLIVIVYAAILVVIEMFMGVPYTEFSKSTNNMFMGVLIPITIGSVILTSIALWSGWWKDLWRDKYHIKDHGWMHIFLVLFIVAISMNFLVGHISSLSSTYILVTLMATILVGYSEELLTRGLLICGARGSGFSEVKVFYIVMIVFGFIHGINFINGQALGLTLEQMFMAGLLGGVFYTIFRKTGFLVVPMIVHALWDFSLFTQGFNFVGELITTSTGKFNPLQIIGIMAIYSTYLLLILAVRNFNVEKSKSKVFEKLSS
jgi:membrane protease YdiL (CAAX protease family)